MSFSTCCLDAEMTDLSLAGWATRGTPSKLETIPYEIFQEICSYLEPIWLWNLSHVCPPSRYHLLGERGNQIWYKALPPALWKEREHYYDTNEVHSMTQEDAITKSESWLMAYADVVSDEHLRQLRALTAELVIKKKNEQDMAMFRKLYPAIANIMVKPSRKRVKALGGPYNADLNYRREILGHMKSKKRCYVCLTESIPNAQSSLCKQWGILWCKNCLPAYSISVRTISETGYSISTKALTLLGYESGGVKYLYLPEINQIFRNYTGLDLRMHQFIQAETAHQLMMKRLQQCPDEVHRRQVRRKIISYAKMIWDGLDPDPDCFYEGLIDGHHQYSFVSRPHVSNPILYQRYRTTWAPTAKLHEFLFPEYLVCDDPTSVPYKGPQRWLEDRSYVLDGQMIGNIADRVISQIAERMVSLLADHIMYDTYLHIGGGRVDTWINAANKYHIDRLEAEIQSGSIVNIAHNTPAGMASKTYFNRIRSLRTKLDLQKRHELTMTPLPRRLDTAEASTHFKTIDSYIEYDRAILAEHAARDIGIKHFNKIARSCCTACPETTGLFWPMGVESLVNHMRICHTHVFMETDDFHIID